MKYTCWECCDYMLTDNFERDYDLGGGKNNWRPQYGICIGCAGETGHDDRMIKIAKEFIKPYKTKSKWSIKEISDFKIKWDKMRKDNEN